MKKIVLSLMGVFALALTGACAGDDASVDADLSAESGDDESIQEYCEFSAELDSRGEEPSEEDLDRIVELAPEEIKDDVETLAEAIKNDEHDSEEATAADQRLQAWEEDNCGRESEEGDADAGSGGDDQGGDADNQDPSSGEPGEAGGDDGGNSGSGGETDTTDGGGAEVEAEIEGGTATTAH